MMPSEDGPFGVRRSILRKAVLLCAGEGTRLRPFTDHVPKAMVSVHGRPLLQYHIDWLKRNGIDSIFINLHYLPDAITQFLGDGSAFGLRITYSYEPILRGTAGALLAFREHLDEAFLLHYGDIYCEVDLRRMLRFHRERKAAATLIAQRTNRPHDSDVLEVDADGQVRAVRHKPGSFQFGNWGNAASYILEPVCLGYLPERQAEIDFVQHLFPRMIAAKERVYAYRNDDECMIDMGTLDRYEQLLLRLSRAGGRRECGASAK